MNGLTSHQRATFAFHKERFEAEFHATDKPFRVELAKYVDRECFDIHWRHMLKDSEFYLTQVAMVGQHDEHTVCGAGESWKSNDTGEMEIATLIGSKPVVAKFEQLAALAGADLPFDVIPNAPFHEFDSVPTFVFREHRGAWIEFVFHILRTPEERHFDFRIDWPKIGCRIATLQTNPFLASARAIDSLIHEVGIPADDRTKPMSYRQAARLMGRGDSKDAGEWLSKSVADGSIPCEHISRQTHIFSKHSFPQSVWSSILPK